VVTRKTIGIDNLTIVFAEAVFLDETLAVTTPVRRHQFSHSLHLPPQQSSRKLGNRITEIGLRAKAIRQSSKHIHEPKNIKQ